jgi:hypothetical protein
VNPFARKRRVVESVLGCGGNRERKYFAGGMVDLLTRALVGAVILTALWLIIAHDVRCARRAENEARSDS